MATPTILRTVDAREGTGQTLNVGEEGLLLQTRLLPNPGTYVWVYFKLGGRQFLAPGVVVRKGEDRLGVFFSQAPAGLRAMLEKFEALRPAEHRSKRRTSLEMLVCIRRKGEEVMEVITPISVSRSGLQFESVHRYQMNERVQVILSFDPRLPQNEQIAKPAKIVRIAALSRWDAFSYGLKFLGPESWA